MKPTTSLSGALCYALLVGSAVPATAEVSEVVIRSCVDVLQGRSFGEVGPYEKCIGTIVFAVDPAHPRNAVIADLDRAPRNRHGKVQFTSDLFVLRPKDPQRGNGVIFFDVVNRGGKQLLGRFNMAVGSTDPVTEAEFGDGYLMREGYTVVAVGWEANPNNPAVAMYAPIATENGRPITGQISGWFIPTEPGREFNLRSQYWTGFRGYLPLDPDDPDYTLTERIGFHGIPTEVPRETWQFGRDVAGRVVYDPDSLRLWTGFKPGYTYELTYSTRDPVVAGLGFAALRDAASYFKYDDRSPIRGQYAYSYGNSQTGRFLRQMIYEGFTVDEEERKAFDMVFIGAGGASLGSFNERFGRPNEGGFHSENRFPILYQSTRDPATGRVDGLGARIPADLHPKVVMFETSSEYWDRGRVVALNHTSLDGSQDVELAENVRFFLMSSYPHSGGPFPPAELHDQQLMGNPIDVRPAMRAILKGMDAWVRTGTPAPPSAHPKLSDRTLIPRASIRFPPIPGVQWPYEVPGGYRVDLEGPMNDYPLPFLVPQVNTDGNEVAGLVLPDVSVPLATYTGWVFRSSRVGAPTEILPMVGGYVPFPRTTAERVSRQDPRLSIEERYVDRSDYLRRYEEAARKLIAEGYLLADDLPWLLRRAGDHWDWLMDR